MLVNMNSLTIDISKCFLIEEIYRVVQKNEATLHFPKYLENY